MKTQASLEPGPAAGVNLKRILVPVDFSPLSKKALHYATRLAHEFRAEINLVHVIEPQVPPAFDGFMMASPRDCKPERRQLCHPAEKLGQFGA